jgi:hypothetical protein
MSAFLQEKSMSYTSGTAMDERGLRDVERWRDKIEVRLDNRQVFFLFFGSALVACLLFVLGVIVGKRLESRGRAVAPEVEDPLALLDKVASTPRTTQAPAVTFPQALFGKNAAGSAKKVESKLVVPVEAKPEVKEAKIEAKTESKSESKSAEPAAAAKPVNAKALAKVDQPSEASKPERPAPVATKPTPAEKPAPVATKPAPPEAPKAAAPKPAVVAAAPAAKSEDAAPKGPVPVVGGATDSAKNKGRFTLQLSSFQERGEAEAFAAKVGAEKTFITVSEIPGKGTWYRVRVGDFASAKDALAGKLAFEKKHNVIAYVTQK